jgi:hypothetical protein
MKHTTHNVLGNYCWTCQRPTAAGVPGWLKPSRNDGPIVVDTGITNVVWLTTEEDLTRTCVHCLMVDCRYPVLDIAISPIGDSYAEKGVVVKQKAINNEN